MVATNIKLALKTNHSLSICSCAGFSDRVLAEAKSCTSMLLSGSVSIGTCVRLGKKGTIIAARHSVLEGTQCLPGLKVSVVVRCSCKENWAMCHASP
jgi:hypothetical protein